MENLVTIEQALELSNPLFIDLRSPVEYEAAHIPGALNIPLFEDDERALVGTIYRENSPESAIDEGFSLAAPKLPGIYRRIKELSSKYNIVLYCWRGGMRSQAISQVLTMLGSNHYRLEGGFKSFRQYVLEFFSKPLTQEIVVLHGLTGVGKTDYLNRLRMEGLPALDLEGLAHNRGSVFGHIGMGRPTTQKQFDGELFFFCRKFRDWPRIMVECESKRIGNVVLPETIFAAMERGRRVLLYDSMENRINRLIAAYALEENPDNLRALRASVERLQKHLGRRKTEDLLEALRERDYPRAVYTLLIDYYDPLYKYPDQPSERYEFNCNAGHYEETFAFLKALLVNG